MDKQIMLEEAIQKIPGVIRVLPYEGRVSGVSVDFTGDVWHNSSLQVICLGGHEECFITGDLIVPANRSKRIQQSVEVMGCQIEGVHPHSALGVRQISLRTLNKIKGRGADHVHPLCHTKSTLGAMMLLKDLVELTTKE